MVQPQMGQQKKGLGVWAWVAIGCVGLLVLAGAGVGIAGWMLKKKVQSMAEDPTATIEMIAALNPDIEVVDRDSDAGTVTIRNKKTDETVTVSMADLAERRISFSTDEGEATFAVDEEAGTFEMRGADGSTAQLGSGARVPDWVPGYPGATAEGVYASQDATTESGTFSLSTTDSLDEVFQHLRGALQDAGYKVTENRYSGSGGEGAMLVGEMEDGSSTITYTLGTNEGRVQVTGGYTRQKS